MSVKYAHGSESGCQVHVRMWTTVDGLSSDGHTITQMDFCDYSIGTIGLHCFPILFSCKRITSLSNVYVQYVKLMLHFGEQFL